MYDENLVGSKGKKIVRIDCSEVDFNIERLSELGENWEIPSKCPSCNRDIYFNKNNVNVLITCNCGQKFKLEIPEELL
jgi:hypothetical protein